MSQVRTWAVVALACAGMLGCKKDAGPGAAAGKAAEGTASEARVLDLYVPCFNEAEKRVHDSWNSYTRWVDLEKGLTGKEKSIDGISLINDYDAGKCLEGLNKALESGASGPLADATQAVVAALGTLMPLVKETKTYYDQKNYKDDAFAKGMQLHGALVAGFDAWKKAEDTLRAVWDERHRASRDAELARVEKERGRKSEQFTTAQVMNTGEAVIEAVTVPAIDPQALTAAIGAYQAAFAELDAFFGPNLTASVDTDRWMFKDQAEKFLTQTKEAMRALGKDKALPKEGDGSEAMLLEKYNDLVERSNSITWD